MASPSIKNEYPLELLPPDISPYAKGNTGIPYVMSFDSGNGDSPHIMLSAVVHGNELCGAIALNWLLKKNIRPLKGKLSLVFANVAAFLEFNPDDPYASRYVDQDFNRVWATELLDSDKTSVELMRAKELRPLLETVDLLFDVHSMQSDSPAMLLSGSLAKGREFAKVIGIPELVVADQGHAEGTRMRDFNDFANPVSEKKSLLIECGQHWAASSGDLAINTCLKLLLSQGFIDQSFIDDASIDATTPQKFIEVTDTITIKTDNFTFIQTFKGGEILATKGTVIGHDDTTPVITPYDNCILIMPNRRTNKGLTAVRLGRFIDE